MRRVTMLLICLALAATCVALGEVPEYLTYFYYNPCASCNEGPEFVNSFYVRVREAGLEQRYNVLTSNAFTDRAPLDQALEALGLPPSTELPLLVMGDRHLSGEGALESDLVEWLTGGLPSSAGDVERAAAEHVNGVDLIYLYVPNCADCVRMKQVLAALECTMVTVREINLYEAPDEGMALFDRFEVPESKRFVPIVFVGDEYFTDPEKVAEELPTWIENARTQE